MTPVLALWTLAGLLALPAAAGDDNGAALPPGPDFEDVLSLRSAGDPRISPAGKTVVYTVRTTDWDDNRYDTELYLQRDGEEPFQLTRTRGESSVAPKWSPDGRWIAFLADRGDKSQVHVIRPTGGEALALTRIEEGVDDFEWSPDGRFIALRLTEPESGDDEKRAKRYGKFAVEDADYRMRHLWLLDVARAMESEDGVERPEDPNDEDEDGERPALRRLSGGREFTVGSFAFSPAGREIAFAHQPDPLINSFEKSDLSVLDVESGKIRPLVVRPGFDGNPIYSPDGAWILFSTSNEKTAYYFNDELAKVPAAGGDVTLLTADFDENVDAVDWLADGIRFIAHQRTFRHLFHLDPETGAIRQLTAEPRYVTAADFTADGREMVVAGFSDATLPELYRGPGRLGADDDLLRPAAVTAMTDQVADWPRPVTELIEWTSRDGTAIEGVVIKPHDFEPGRRYPLLVIIHGGPAAVAMPQRVHGYVYPVVQWLAKGAVVLLPNYRGSTGYGEAFRRLNVRNLGVGDAWDVLSGVDHLVAQRVADPERLGAMGWSQGGYISAFLATTSDRFRAISVGAGISNWTTYYVNTDVHPFTRHYLEATPWEDPGIYAKTSPMHYIREAKTPTLIQHGEYDRRVPIPNAYELFQGLEDVGVEVRLVVYKGFGHGIDKPKERLAAVWHNWQWFAKHLWGEDVELPLE